MKRSILTVLGLLVFGTAVFGQHNTPPEGFTALFNGKDLSGWYGMGTFSPIKLAAMTEEKRQAKRAADTADMKKHWSVENGELVNDGHGAYMTTDRDYGDFELRLEYKTVPEADSGIYLRANPQVQIWDWTKEAGKWHLGADKGSGGLWNNDKGAPGKDPLVRADKPFGEWNHFRIVQVGARTSVWLNGQQVVKHAIMNNYWARERAHFPTGPIQLQTHGGEIRWRNVYIKELNGDEATKILAKHGEIGFESVFNGKDFTGWSGPVDNYEAHDGVLKCKHGKGGTIFTDQEYGDFVARLEFKVPPGGNNGLAIRYPGKGDTAYHGMCELQVLDSEHPKYAKLDARQYHGSAYGMAAATRGYTRPAGQWNFQEVTVKGSTIKVELNGSVILNADLSEVTDFMAGKPHPGKDIKRGHFGFAGHHDAVEYRNIRIKRLDGTDAVESTKLGTTKNVHRVGSIFLAGQPKPADIAVWKEAGVKRVLNLRRAAEVDWDEVMALTQAGIAHDRLPFSGADSLTDEVFTTARTAFAAANDDAPLVCHCGSANRVGAVWLTYRVLDQGVEWDKALAEAKEVGLRNPAYEARAKEYISQQ